MASLAVSQKAARQRKPDTGQLLATLRGHTGTVRSVALSADGSLLASGGTDGTVRLWETRTRIQTGIRHGQTDGIWSVAVSADGHRLVSGGTDGTVSLGRLP